MVAYWFSLQRASWKWRALALVIFVFAVKALPQLWADAHEPLALVRGYGWFSILVNIIVLFDATLIGIFGRMPKWFTRRPSSLHRTLAQIHAEFAKQQRDQQEKSREL